MTSRRHTAQLRATLLALAVVAATGCATPRRAPLLEGQRTRLDNVKTVASFARPELGVSIEVSKIETYFPGAGMPSLIDAPINAHRTRVAENAAAPIRQAIVDHDAGSALRAALEKELGSLPWLEGNVVELKKVTDTREGIAQAVQESGANYLLLVQVDHRFTPAFDAIVITARVSVLEKATARPLYLNTILTARRHPGLPAGKTPLELAARLWTDANGVGARHALDDGMAELAAMIAFDLTEAKDTGGNLYDARGNPRAESVPNAYGADMEGYVVREPNGRIWVRFKNGDLSAFEALAR